MPPPTKEGNKKQHIPFPAGEGEKGESSTPQCCSPFAGSGCLGLAAPAFCCKCLPRACMGVGLGTGSPAVPTFRMQYRYSTVFVFSFFFFSLCCCLIGYLVSHGVRLTITLVFVSLRSYYNIFLQGLEKYLHMHFAPEQHIIYHKTGSATDQQ